jgi:RNA polymerase sigma-70 factor (ECF subfamily)
MTAMQMRTEELPRQVRRGSRDNSVEEEDATLMLRIATADMAAMHILFLRHQLAVYRFVLQRIQDRRLAEDVTCEVFLQVWRHAGRFDGRSAALTWILSIARRKTFKARPQSRLRFAGGEGAGELDATPRARERHNALRTCMTKLPAEHREVIDLVYYQEQSMESVAAILGVPRTAAKTRVFCARKRLADELKKSDAGRRA